MPFSDNFTGTNGQKLSARTGWTLLLGTDDFSISSNQLVRTSGTTVNGFYGTGDNSTTTQTVAGDIKFASNVGLMVLATVSGSNLNGYFLQAQTGLTATRLNRVVNNVKTALVTVSGLTNCDNLELRSSVNVSGNVDLLIFQNGAQIGSFTDSNVAKLTSGQRGIAISASVSMSPALDNYADNYSAALSVAITITEPSSGFVFEGIRQASALSIPVAWTGAPTAIQARLVDSAGTALLGFDWTTKIASPAANSSGTVSFASVPVGGFYKVQVRDTGTGAQTDGSNEFYVGGVVVFWGRSQARKVRILGFADTLAPTSLNKTSVLFLNSDGTSGAASIARFTGGQGALSGGIVALANQWQADTSNTPLMIVDASYPGMAITDFINDTAVGTPSWGLWTGQTNAVLTATRGQVSAFLWMSAESGNSGFNPLWAGYADTLAGMFDTKLGNANTVPIIIMPHLRANNGSFTYDLRQRMHDKANSGGRWRHGGWLLDHVMDGDTSPHQAAGAAGNQRIGTNLGRALSFHLVGGVSRTGPIATGAQFTDASATVIDVTFDRAIETPDASTTGIKAVHVSTNNGGAFADPPTGFTVALTASDKARITKSSGAWTGGVTRIDFLRGIPFNSDSAAADYAGTEATLGATYLDKMIYDTSSFNGGRGQPVAPIMGIGLPVALPVTITATAVGGGNTTSTVRYVQP